MRHPTLLAAGLAVAILLTTACGDGADTPLPTRTAAPATATPTTGPTEEPFVLEGATTTASGLQYVDTVVGTGAQPQAGQQVTLHYTLRLAGQDDILQTTAGGDPPMFSTDRVIPGFREGILGMKVGGKRTMYLPAAIAYGNSSPDPSIPAGSNLLFEVELISVQ